MYFCQCMCAMALPTPPCQLPFHAGKVLSVAQFRQRAAQILTSYGEVRGQENHSYLQKLVRGMPKRLAACKANAYGPCGK